MPYHSATMQHRRQSFIRPNLQGRQPRRQPTRRRPPSRGGRPSSPTSRTLFHAPSFSAGVVMGAVVVLGAAYLPELMSTGEPAAQPPAAGVADPRPALTFEFDDLLRNSRVTADPEPYLSAPAPEGRDVKEEILLQAASFRSRDDAERLRAALLLMDLPATTSSITLNNGAWYRVTVGPFDSRVKAERALTRLREKDIAAIWTKRPKS
jgi:hypothetical protein